MSKLIRLSFNVDGDSNFQRILVLPITDDKSKKIVSDCGCNAEEALNPLYEKIAKESSKQLMDFVFTLSNTPVELIVSDDETEEEIYSDDEFTIEPTYGVMSMDEINENYPDDDDKEAKEEQENYLKRTKHDSNGLFISGGFSKAWDGLINNTVSCASFVPIVIKESLKASGAKSALLAGESEVCSSTITFKIELKDDEEFDVDKLDFINFDESYDDYSPVLNNLLENDMVSMNAIIYDGKMYFAGHNDFDYDENNGNSYYDFVNEDIESEEPNIEINAPVNVPKYKSPDEWPKEAHEFLKKKIVEKDGWSLSEKDEKLIQKVALQFDIDPDLYLFEAKALWEKDRKRRNEKRDIERFLGQLREGFRKYTKGYDCDKFQILLVEAKTKYKDEPTVQETLKEIEAINEKHHEEALQKENQSLHKSIYREQMKLKADAEAMRLKTQMLKDEAEYKKLKEEKDKRDAEEREARLIRQKQINEENMRKLKENWPIIKKCLIGFVIFAVTVFLLLLFFGPNR